MRKEELNQLPDCAREFITYLNIIKGKSDLTVLEYASDLRTFFRYLKVLRGLASPDDDFEKIDISDIDIPFIEKISLMDAYNYLVYCKDVRKNSDRTRARKVSTLRQFFDYLYKKTKKIKENPMSELEMPKFKKSMPKYLTYDQCVALLNSVEGKNKQRDYCILTLFLNCGLRLAELCSLNYSDIRDDGTMIVTGKGDKERIVYFDARTKIHLQNYIDSRKDDDPALFVTLRTPHTRLGIGGIESRLRAMGKQLDIQKVHPHKFRRTLATMAIDKGMPIEQLQQLLGHKRIDTTLQYAMVKQSNVKQAHRKYIG